MSNIENSDKIDTMGFSNELNKLILEIYDHLDWNDEQNHLNLLQNKLNTYLSFIESGEIANSRVYIENKPIMIKVCFLEKPTINAIKYLDFAIKTIDAAGFELKYSIEKV